MVYNDAIGIIKQLHYASTVCSLYDSKLGLESLQELTSMQTCGCCERVPTHFFWLCVCV